MNNWTATCAWLLSFYFIAHKRFLVRNAALLLKKAPLLTASLPDFNQLRWEITQERAFLSYSAHTLHNFTSRMSNFPKINTLVTSNPIKRHFPNAATCTRRYLASVIGVLGRRNCCSSKPSSLACFLWSSWWFTSGHSPLNFVPRNWSNKEKVEGKASFPQKTLCIRVAGYEPIRNQVSIIPTLQASNLVFPHQKWRELPQKHNKVHLIPCWIE